ncbi:MAG: pyridoxamine 5'-phosphate oxidase [Pseudohongiellaceae bacterium]|nr:pyridoxamine 5'-phosphate oxidase [Pseudohongiellaceae bacterium]
MDLNAHRREYLKGGLNERDLTPNPIDLFSRWMQEALDMELLDANAMSVASVDSNGQPSQRIVLLKSVDEKGFVFFTNYDSRKGREIAGNAKVSLHFPWHSIERQVSICGVAHKVTEQESQQYFSSRPLESQLAALASAQSQQLDGKDKLIAKFNELKAQYAGQSIPLPPAWGGYRVVPNEIEFWQGGAHRLHDRFQYQRCEDGTWQARRLAP